MRNSASSGLSRRVWAALRTFSRRLMRDSRGASYIEYIIVCGCVTLMAITAFQRFGKTLHTGLKEEAKHIEGEGFPGAADLLKTVGGLQNACEVAGVCPVGGVKCFAAGTPVATETGERPIELIQVGDRVWARDMDTGALELRQVVQRFVTEQQPVIEVQLSSAALGGATETLRVTSGHRFWVEGRGWTYAADLGDAPLYSMRDPVNAATSTSVSELTTVYNLEVEGAHNYFVGHSQALVHNGDPKDDADCIKKSQEEFEKLKEELKKAGKDPPKTLYPEQTCPDSVREQLKTNKDAACNTIPYGSMSPSATSEKKLNKIPCSHVRERLAAQQACLGARQVMQSTCFAKGPIIGDADSEKRDKNHKDQMQDVQNGINQTRAREAINCKPGHPMANL